MQKFREYTKPYALVYVVTGIGLGLLICAVFKSVYDLGATVGIIVTVLGVLGSFVWGK
ncbi:hypothetical protein M1555_02465 [Patescibacteria group bacterium]|nr:hypothetical protein [Patescibacteria group bacterium]